jgi:hypothetical protein
MVSPNKLKIARVTPQQRGKYNSVGRNSFNFKKSKSPSKLLPLRSPVHQLLVGPQELRVGILDLNAIPFNLEPLPQEQDCGI